MPNFESITTGSTSEAASVDIQAEGNVTKPVESELPAEDDIEASSPELQLQNLEGQLDSQQQNIDRLAESIKNTTAKLDEVRAKLGLPSVEADAPSSSVDKSKLEELQSKKDALNAQKEDLVSQQEKENLIREEKNKILQEKLDALFKEFESFNAEDLENIANSGKTKAGRGVESSSMGTLDPETAKALAKVFKEGIKLLPKILETLPELFKKFDDDLTREATERVNKKLEAEKQKIAEEEKPEVKPADSNSNGEQLDVGKQVPSDESVEGAKVDDSAAETDK